MTVTAIISTLPYVAYRTYRVRSEVSEGIALATTIAPLIVETIRHGDGVPRELAAAIPIAFEKTLTTSVVDSVAVVDGRIDVIFGNEANSAIVGQQISLTPYETADQQVRAGLEPTRLCAQRPATCADAFDDRRSLPLPAGCR